MNTPQSQIKINLSRDFKQLIEKKAKRFGVPVAGYIKHVLMKDIEEEIPVFKMSRRTERRAKQALKNIDKAVTVTNKKELKEFFKNL